MVLHLLLYFFFFGVLNSTTVDFRIKMETDWAMKKLWMKLLLFSSLDKRRSQPVPTIFVEYKRRLPVINITLAEQFKFDHNI